MAKTRGIQQKFAEEFRKCELYRLYEEYKNELIIGVRNNYLNLYYNCDSIAKIKYINGSICCEIDKYYLDGKHYREENKEKRIQINQSQICAQYETIKKHSDAKATQEKKAQSKLVLLNNLNKHSKWFCVDIEYVKSFNNISEKEKSDFNARFDIIALSKETHEVALIELKYGKCAIGGKSGIYKHVHDFIKFCEKNFFERHLKQEITEIIKSQISLGLYVPFEFTGKVCALTPKFYFITLNNNAEKENSSTPKQTMAGYLFSEKRWGCKRLSKNYCVENEFGDITDKKNKFNATFMFSNSTLDNIAIIDIITHQYYDDVIEPK